MRSGVQWRHFWGIGEVTPVGFPTPPMRHLPFSPSPSSLFFLTSPVRSLFFVSEFSVRLLGGVCFEALSLVSIDMLCVGHG